jgi:NADPH:quinone reductase-like Zn-dependent oxidoreductase
MRTSYIFGCLPGWWLSTEPYRKWSPLVPAERWDQLLKDNQFTGTDLVYDGSSRETALSSLVVSSACNNKPANDVIYPRSDLIIVRSKASALQHSLSSSIQIISGEAGLQASIIDAASIQGDPTATYVFLQTMDQFSFQNPQEDEYGALKKVLQKVKNVLWVTRRSKSNVKMLEQDGVFGLSRSIVSEIEGLKMVTLGLEEVEDTQKATQNIWSVLCHYFELISTPSTKTDGEEIAEIDGNLCTSRLIPAKMVQNSVQIIQARDDQLRVELESPYNGIIGDEDVEIEVQAISYRFHCEYSGTITQLGKHAKGLQVGTRAIAVIPNGRATLNARVKCPAVLVHPIPDELKFEEAVAMPIDFMIAYDALINWARLRKRDSVLIHDGAGELGQAAIQIAMLEGADVFIICTKAEDAKLMSDLYQVPISHALVYTSSGNCLAHIKQLTGGRGIDVVFNPLARKELPTLWESVAFRGRVVEMGILDKTSIGSSSLSHSQSIKKNVMFASIDLSEILQDRERVVALFSTVMSIIKSKKITAARPLHVYTRSEVEDMLRSKKDSGMPSGKTILNFAPNRANSMLTSPETSLFDVNATYLITGGLGGLGKSIAKWMVVRGARNLLLLSRSGASGAASFLDAMKASGVTILTPKCDIGDENAVRKTLQEVGKHLPPIKGCIQASMVLKVSPCLTSFKYKQSKANTLQVCYVPESIS